MAFQNIYPKQEISITTIYTIHYFEYMSDFSFPGESHNFWEFLCVDKGEINVQADENIFTLKKGDLIFHKPNEFHDVKGNGQIAPNLVVVSFDCSSPAMDFFKDRILSIDQREQNLLAEVIIETRNSFSNRLDDPYFNQLVRRKDSEFGSEQLIRLYIEQFLIHLLRRYTRSVPVPPETPKTLKRKTETELYNRIHEYLDKNLGSKLTIEQISHDNMVSRSQLQKLMQEKTGCGIIEYFSKLKIDMAKQLIRENHLNFTQISEYLGYTSVHYFSRQFKKITGMNPSEYSSSIKGLAETPEDWNKTWSHPIYPS